MMDRFLEYVAKTITKLNLSISYDPYPIQAIIHIQLMDDHNPFV